MKTKKMMGVWMLMLIVLSTVVIAEEECGFFCKIENWLKGTENVAGLAGGTPQVPILRTVTPTVPPLSCSTAEIGQYCESGGRVFYKDSVYLPESDRREVGYYIIEKNLEGSYKRVGITTEKGLSEKKDPDTGQDPHALTISTPEYRAAVQGNKLSTLPSISSTPQYYKNEVTVTYPDDTFGVRKEKIYRYNDETSRWERLRAGEWKSVEDTCPVTCSENQRELSRKLSQDSYNKFKAIKGNEQVTWKEYGYRILNEINSRIDSSGSVKGIPPKEFWQPLSPQASAEIQNRFNLFQRTQLVQEVENQINSYNNRDNSELQGILDAPSGLTESKRLAIKTILSRREAANNVLNNQLIGKSASVVAEVTALREESDDVLQAVLADQSKTPEAKQAATLIINSRKVKETEISSQQVVEQTKGKVQLVTPASAAQAVSPLATVAQPGVAGTGSPQGSVSTPFQPSTTGTGSPPVVVALLDLETAKYIITDNNGIPFYVREKEGKIEFTDGKNAWQEILDKEVKTIPELNAKYGALTLTNTWVGDLSSSEKRAIDIVAERQDININNLNNLNINDLSPLGISHPSETPLGMPSSIQYVKPDGSITDLHIEVHEEDGKNRFDYFDTEGNRVPIGRGELRWNNAPKARVFSKVSSAKLGFSDMPLVYQNDNFENSGIGVAVVGIGSTQSSGLIYDPITRRTFVYSIATGDNEGIWTYYEPDGDRIRLTDSPELIPLLSDDINAAMDTVVAKSNEIIRKSVSVPQVGIDFESKVQEALSKGMYDEVERLLGMGRTAGLSADKISTIIASTDSNLQFNYYDYLYNLRTSQAFQAREAAIKAAETVAKLEEGLDDLKGSARTQRLSDIDRAKAKSERLRKDAQRLTAEANEALDHLSTLRAVGRDSVNLIDKDVRDFMQGDSDTSHREAYQRAKALADNARTKLGDIITIDAEVKDLRSSIARFDAEIKALEDAHSTTPEAKKNLADLKTQRNAQAAELDVKNTELEELLSDNKISLAEKERLLNDIATGEDAAERYEWQGSWLEGIGGEAYAGLVNGKWVGWVGGIAQGIASIGGRYRALSNLLIPDETLKKWTAAANDETLQRWANLPSFVASVGPKFGFDYCNIDDLKKTNQAGQNYVFVQTPGGVKQPVAQIFGETAESTVFIGCTADKDNKLSCKGSQICKADKFCYLNRDAAEPVTGHYYKITWGLGVPGDQSFTPYVDESGKAVKFNIRLRGPTVEKYLYVRGSLPATQVLELENGAKDGATLAFYSSEIYNEACIVFDTSYRIKDFSAGEFIPDVCAKIDPAKISDQLDFLESNRKQPSITTQSEQVTTNEEI